MTGENHSKPYVATTKWGIWIDERLPLPRFLYEHIFNFLIPYNLNYFYTFGAIALFMLVSQIFSGIVMAMHYVPNISMAFESREYIKRSVNFGWLFTSIHSIGASFFFLSIYIHMGRGLYYGSYKKPRELVWAIGVILFFIMLFIAFTGYAASWSLVSNIAVTVISNFIEKIPIIGPYLSSALLGGTTLGQHSLTRLYAMHIILPFILCGFLFLHIWSVHRVGQGNPAGVELTKPEEFIPFAPYGIIKDCIAICCFAILFAIFVFYMPDLLQSSNSMINGDITNISSSIEPEWYFVPFYTMLRSATFKIGFISAGTVGVFTVIAALVILLFLPILDHSSIYATKDRPIYRIGFWLFIADIILLGYLGYQPPNPLAIALSQIGTGYYFIFFLLIMPVAPLLEASMKKRNKKEPRRAILVTKKSFKLW